MASSSFALSVYLFIITIFNQFFDIRANGFVGGDGGLVNKEAVAKHLEFKFCLTRNVCFNPKTSRSPFISF